MIDRAASHGTSSYTQALACALLPEAGTIAMIQASLSDGDACRVAWQRWTRLTPDPLRLLRKDRIGIKRHLPPLYENLTRQGIPIDREIEPYLRTALAREQMRNRRYREGLVDALGALAEARIDCTILRGAAVAELYLPAPWLRHSHDADFFVPDAFILSAIAALRQKGFTDSASGERNGTYCLRHRTGLPVMLHTRLLGPEAFELDIAAMLQRRCAANILGHPVRVLCAEDMLVHVCTHAATNASRANVGWMMDAAVLARQQGFDWLLVREACEDASIARLLAATLHLLARHMLVTVPQQLLDELGQVRDPATAVEKHAIVAAACRTMSPWRLLLVVRGSARREICLHCIRRMRDGLHRLWNDWRLVHVRRHPVLRPLRLAYLAVKRQTFARNTVKAEHPEP